MTGKVNKEGKYACKKCGEKFRLQNTYARHINGCKVIGLWKRNGKGGKHLERTMKAE